MNRSLTEKCKNGRKHQLVELWQYDDDLSKFVYIMKVCARCGKGDVNETMGDSNG